MLTFGPEHRYRGVSWTVPSGLGECPCRRGFPVQNRQGKASDDTGGHWSCPESCVMYFLFIISLSLFSFSLLG